jgi:hypothetical protein
MWRMRRWLLLLAITGCFSEANDPPGACTPGEPGCDCTRDGTCVEGSECVASIDKCVPENCMPGSRTCTCAPGDECLGALTCQEGVCLDPQPETTGDPTNASTNPSTTDATNTGPMTSSPGTETVTDTVTDTMPSDTGTASEPTTDTGSEVSDDSSSVSTTMPIADVPVMVVCSECLVDASMNDACSSYFDNCAGDSEPDGCGELYICATTSGDSVQNCCDDNNGTMTGHILWGVFADCAQEHDCMMQCYLMCGV